MKVYIGSIDFGTMPSEFSQFVETQIGPIEKLVWITHKITRDFRGFCFVEFRNPDDATRALFELNGAEYKGRKLKVAEATPQPPRP